MGRARARPHPHPLGTTETFVPTVEQVPGRVIDGYADADGDGRPENVGGGSWPAVATEGEAVGNLVSTVQDLLRFAVALFRGDLLRPVSRDAMLRAGRRYGLGVQHWQAASGVSAVGHSGSEPGFGASLAYLPEQDVAVVVLANDAKADPTDLVAVTARLLTGKPCEHIATGPHRRAEPGSKPTRRPPPVARPGSYRHGRIVAVARKE